MNTLNIEPERLVLRNFTENDLEALYGIYSDTEVNRFLPWFPLKSMEEAETFFKEHYKNLYDRAGFYGLAVCLKTDNRPIGYIHVSADDSHDFGYGLKQEFWNQGIMTEAAKAVIEQLKRDGISYITATHDIKNPRSGSVMKKLGMKYCYSYREQWMPKNIPVIFRMYQLNLDENESRIYKKYWNEAEVRFVEEMEDMGV